MKVLSDRLLQLFVEEAGKPACKALRMLLGENTEALLYFKNSFDSPARNNFWQKKERKRERPCPVTIKDVERIVCNCAELPV